MEFIAIELESKLGHVREYECECRYNPESTGGSYGNEFETIPAYYELRKVYRNGIDISKWIFSSQKLTRLFNEKVDETL